MKLKDIAPWKKSYDKPRQHIKKQTYHFANEGPLVKAMVFPVVMCECESWTIKKAECLRIDAFQLCCWRNLLKVLWTARRSNQSTLKEINPEYSLKGLIPKLKLQYFGHLLQRADSLEKTWCWERLKAEREGDDKGRDGWMLSWLNGHEFEQGPGDGEGKGSLACCDPWGHKESDMNEQLNNNNTVESLIVWYREAALPSQCLTTQGRKPE